MTDVIARPRTNRLNDSLALLLGLPPQRISVLAGAIRNGRVCLSEQVLQLPVGVAQGRINGYSRDIADYSPAGIERLQTRLAEARRNGKTDLVRTLTAKIGNAPGKFTVAQTALADAVRRREEREAIFRRWLRSSGMPQAWVAPVVTALRSNVTYVRMMRTPNDRIGTLYIERD